MGRSLRSLVSLVSLRNRQGQQRRLDQWLTATFDLVVTPPPEPRWESVFILPLWLNGRARSEGELGDALARLTGSQALELRHARLLPPEHNTLWWELGQKSVGGLDPRCAQEGMWAVTQVNYPGTGEVQWGWVVDPTCWRARALFNPTDLLTKLMTLGKITEPDPSGSKGGP